MQVLYRLQFLEFPDVYLVVVALQLPGGRAPLVRCVMNTPRHCVLQALDEKVETHRSTDRRFYFADHSILHIEDDGKHGIFAIMGDTYRIWLSSERQRTDAPPREMEQVEERRRRDQDGVAVSLVRVDTVPRWAQVLECARSLPPRNLEDAQHQAEWAAAIVLSRRDHRQPRIRPAERRWSRDGGGPLLLISSISNPQNQKDG